MVADYNNVYERSTNTGYLRYPNSNDDAFLDKTGTADAAAYSAAVSANPTVAADFLRWPNAGAFAAFYSFVACANPPRMADATAKADTQVNTASIIYAKATAQTYTAQATDGYKYFGSQALEARTLVMSQSDSDYRDENCDQRTFRANLRQVGNGITVCGPGQLPDTDEKRCTWNWNYNPASQNPANSPNVATADAEEWFDRNNPHSFDTWSTRKRRTAQANDRKYAFNMGYWGVQEGNSYAGFDSGNSFDAENPTHSEAIKIPITPYKFNLKFKNARNEELPNSAGTPNTDGCFFASTCECRPHLDELNSYGFQKSDGTDLNDMDDTIFVQASFDTTEFWHASCSDSANQNANNVNKCTTEKATFEANLVTLTNTCDFFKQDKTEGFRFENDHSRQALAFDAGLDENNSQITAVFNPASDHWEVSVHCNNVVQNQALSSNQAQRDMFPNCFFGDELWFTLTYGTGDDSVANGNNFSYNSYASAWFSEVNVEGDGDFTEAYLV